MDDRRRQGIQLIVLACMRRGILAALILTGYVTPTMAETIKQLIGQVPPFADTLERSVVPMECARRPDQPIPDAGVHVVSKGESLWLIASRIWPNDATGYQRLAEFHNGLIDKGAPDVGHVTVTREADQAKAVLRIGMSIYVPPEFATSPVTNFVLPSHVNAPGIVPSQSRSPQPELRIAGTLAMFDLTNQVARCGQDAGEFRNTITTIRSADVSIHSDTEANNDVNKMSGSAAALSQLCGPDEIQIAQVSSPRSKADTRDVGHCPASAIAWIPVARDGLVFVMHKDNRYARDYLHDISDPDVLEDILFFQDTWKDIANEVKRKNSGQRATDVPGLAVDRYVPPPYGAAMDSLLRVLTDLRTRDPEKKVEQRVKELQARIIDRFLVSRNALVNYQARLHQERNDQALSQEYPPAQMHLLTQLSSIEDLASDTNAIGIMTYQQYNWFVKHEANSRDPRLIPIPFHGMKLSPEGLSPNSPPDEIAKWPFFESLSLVFQADPEPDPPRPGERGTGSTPQGKCRFVKFYRGKVYAFARQFDLFPLPKVEEDEAAVQMSEKCHL